MERRETLNLEIQVRVLFGEPKEIPVAQRLEQQTFNLRDVSSKLTGDTNSMAWLNSKARFIISKILARVQGPRPFELLSKLASVVELAYTSVSKAGASRHAGSNPARRTKAKSAQVAERYTRQFEVLVRCDVS